MLPQPREMGEAVSDDLATLQNHLAATARQIAKVLTQTPVDREAVAELDRKAGELRRRISAAYPPREHDDHYARCGSTGLLSGGVSGGAAKNTRRL